MRAGMCRLDRLAHDLEPPSKLPWPCHLRLCMDGNVDRMFAGVSRQKSYADRRSKQLEFKVGDMVLLKVSSWKGTCLVDENLIIPLDKIQLDDKLHFTEEPVEIVDREVKRLKQSRIPIIKVCWNLRRGPEFTWEHEDQFKNKYPHLFTSKGRADQSI
ncbi:hypothetical protein Tco_0989472 [Tanacetum coccineum]|uniref:Reverse transcriptase domain-containing protein n=1 Tax=Tanacetum coccineum TaxID=301880 RepID=A0ABQ5ETR1_9ASTR